MTMATIFLLMPIHDVKAQHIVCSSNLIHLDLYAPNGQRAIPVEGYQGNQYTVRGPAGPRTIVIDSIYDFDLGVPTISVTITPPSGAPTTILATDLWSVHDYLPCLAISPGDPNIRGRYFNFGITFQPGTTNISITATLGSVTNTITGSYHYFPGLNPDFSFSPSTPCSFTMDQNQPSIEIPLTFDIADNLTSEVEVSVNSGMWLQLDHSYGLALTRVVDGFLGSTLNSSIRLLRNGSIPLGSHQIWVTVSTTDPDPPPMKIIKTCTGTVTVTGATTDFTLAATPLSFGMAQGTASTFASIVTVGAQNGFTGEVALTLPDPMPAGITATWVPMPASITTSGAKTLNLVVDASVAANTYTIPVTGTSGALSHAASIVITVGAAGQRYRCNGAACEVNPGGPYNSPNCDNACRVAGAAAPPVSDATPSTACPWENSKTAPAGAATPKEPWEFKPEVEIPGLFFGKITIDGQLLGKYIKAVFVYFIWIAGILAVVMLMWGGIRWVAAAGNPSQITVARDIIQNAIIGLIIALTSVLILNTISPQFINLKGLAIVEVKPCVFIPDPVSGENNEAESCQRAGTGEWLEPENTCIFSSYTYHWPVGNADNRITSDFGLREGKVGSSCHAGIDIGTDGQTGKDILAAVDGTVKYVRDVCNEKSLQLWTNDLHFTYIHLSDITVTDGAAVKAGALIAHSGGSQAVAGKNCSEAPHLHLALYGNPNKIHDPEPCLRGDNLGQPDGPPQEP